MDDMEDDARYPPKSLPLNRQNPSHRQKHPIRGSLYQHRRHHPHRTITSRYEEDGEDEDLEVYDLVSDSEDDAENGYGGNFEDDHGFERNPKKKRKLRGSSVSNYEFAPRVKLPHGVRNSSEEWTEHATFVLLEVWGDKFLQLGRKSLRSEDWHDVAEKVSDELKMERTEAQCRNVLDKLKRRYKKEKAKMDEMGLNYLSKWAFFKKMDMLMASSARQEHGLACGVDSGEYVFMNTRVYLNRSNGFDEMRDSPGESETSEEDNSEGVGVGRRRAGIGIGIGGDEEEEEDETSFRVLTDSIEKFGKIYEKIENSKRQQMMELEKMRMDFNRELELQKKQILERAQAEIAKLQEGAEEEEDDDEEEEEEDASAENSSE